MKAVMIINKTLIYVFFTLVSLFSLYPLIYVVSAAFSPGQGVASLNIIPFGDGFTLDRYRYIFTKTEYTLWFKNTFQVAIATSAFTTIVASIGAYVFSRFVFLFKKTLMLSMLILQIFPSFVGMVALYVILLRIGGLDELWGLVLIYLAGNIPYNTWLVKSYMDTIPKSIDEAARIDGANHLRIYFTIIVPVAKPILIFLAITSFTGPWMDFIFPKMVLRSPEKQTLALGLYNFVTERKNEFTNFAAGALLVAIPFVIFFMMTQKMLIESLGGAVKE